MPVQILFQTTGNDTLVDIPINSTPEHVEITLADSVTSIQFDPDYWLLHKHQIYYGIEEYTNNTPVYNDFFFKSNPTQSPEIELVVNQAGIVRIIVYDASGRICTTIDENITSPGHYSSRIDRLPAGVYFCKLETPVNERVKKLVVIK